MPYYKISHLTPLTVTQKDTLAARLTDLHATRFRVLRNSITVRFRQLSDTGGDDIYIGGRRRVANYLVATVPESTRGEWSGLCRDVVGLWEEVMVVNAAPRGKGSGGEEGLRLRGVYLRAGEVWGWEDGMVLPDGGREGEWLERCWREMVERAERGEEVWRANVQEARERGLVDEGRAGMTAQQRLEEMLGWGDAA